MEEEELLIGRGETSRMLIKFYFFLDFMGMNSLEKSTEPHRMQETFLYVGYTWMNWFTLKQD